MNKSITRLIVGLIYTMCLASCTVYKDPVSYSYVDINTGIKIGGNVDVRTEMVNPAKPNSDNLTRLKNALNEDDVEPPKAASAPVVSAPKVEVCSRFVSPNIGPLPRMTEQQMEALSKLPTDKFNEALLTHMKSMYRYSKAARAGFAEAVKAHATTCRMVVIQ